MKNLASILLTNVLILCTITPISSSAQEIVKPVSSKEVSEYFDQYFNVDSRLVNGDFYQTPNLSSTTGHPFFMSSEWKNGSLKMEGDEFHDLLLRYDIHTGQIILNSAGFTNSAVQLVLKKDRIESFTMGGNLFQPFPDEHSMTGIQFCQVLVEGEIDFLNVKTKNLKVSSSGLSDFAYSEHSGKFLRIDEEIRPFKNRRTLLKLYPDFKSDLKEYISLNKLKFRRMSLMEQAAFISHCNSLIEELK